MRTEVLWLNGTIAAIGGFLGWYLGGLDSFLYALIAFTLVDFITAFMCALHDKKLSSRVGARVIYKKAMIFLLVGIGHMVDVNVLGHDGAVRTLVIFFYLTNEGVSLLENMAYLGLPIPQRLREVLLSLHSSKQDEYLREAADEDNDEY